MDEKNKINFTFQNTNQIKEFEEVLLKTIVEVNIQKEHNKLKNQQKTSGEFVQVGTGITP